MNTQTNTAQNDGLNQLKDSVKTLMNETEYTEVYQPADNKVLAKNTITNSAVQIIETAPGRYTIENHPPRGSNTPAHIETHDVVINDASLETAQTALDELYSNDD